ncbi:MAG TPA: anti-sigma factor [Gaiellaceae bacterium]|nr:anti-sigma factor [Gaiellaceae bacterium]
MIHDLTAAYALDALEGEERERYETHLATCPPCREELQSFWRVSGSLAHAAGGPSPPPALRERILAEASRDRPNVVPLRRRLALPAAASIAAVAAVAAIGLGLWGASLSSELDDVRGQLSGNEEALAIVSDPDARQVPLSGADGRVVIASTGRAALVLSNLERAPAGKTYEIWVIEGGTAQPAGLFEGAETRTVVAVTRPVPDDAVVAVTLENEGGAEAPSGSPLFSTPTI